MRRQGGNCRETESRLDCFDQETNSHDAGKDHESKVDLESLTDGEIRMSSRAGVGRK